MATRSGAELLETLQLRLSLSQVGREVPALETADASIYIQVSQLEWSR